MLVFSRFLVYSLIYARHSLSSCMGHFLIETHMLFYTHLPLLGYVVCKYQHYWLGQILCWFLCVFFGECNRVALLASALILPITVQACAGSLILAWHLLVYNTQRLTYWYCISIFQLASPYSYGCYAFLRSFMCIFSLGWLGSLLDYQQQYGYHHNCLQSQAAFNHMLGRTAP